MRPSSIVTLDAARADFRPGWDITRPADNCVGIAPIVIVFDTSSHILTLLRTKKAHLVKKGHTLPADASPRCFHDRASRNRRPLPVGTPPRRKCPAAGVRVHAGADPHSRHRRASPRSSGRLVVSAGDPCPAAPVQTGGALCPVHRRVPPPHPPPHARSLLT